MPKLPHKAISQLYADEITFPLDDFRRLICSFGWHDLEEWSQYWDERGILEYVYRYWPEGTRADWFWGLGLPFFSEIEFRRKVSESPLLIGLSGLPGCGKTSFGKWIEKMAKIFDLPICVISLDDFYLPSPRLDISMQGNPWGVPRGLPGSHDLEALNETIDKFLNHGILSSPRFEKSLRNGKGDRSGWRLSRPDILMIEGWFLGVNPKPYFHEKSNLNRMKHINFSSREIEYSFVIQKELKKYQEIWKYFLTTWHFKSLDIGFTCKWKREQEAVLKRSKGSSLEGSCLTDFIRMTQAALPEEDLMSIKADVIAHIDINREIRWIGKALDEL